MESECPKPHLKGVVDTMILNITFFKGISFILLFRLIEEFTHGM